MSLYNVLRDSFGGAVMRMDGGQFAARRAWRLEDEAGSITVAAVPYKPASPKAEPIGWDAEIEVVINVPGESPVMARHAARWLTEQDAVTGARRMVRVATAAILRGAAALVREPTSTALAAESAAYKLRFRRKTDDRPAATRAANCRRNACISAISATLNGAPLKTEPVNDEPAAPAAGEG